jgi:hypothetical protein
VAADADNSGKPYGGKHYWRSPGRVRDIGRSRPNGVLVPACHSTNYMRAITESTGEEFRLRWSQASRVAAVSLAGGFVRQTVAEGVERCATVNLLCDLGVDDGQSYALGRPAPAESLLSGRHHR